MLDSRYINYESILNREIEVAGLKSKVFMLDTLSYEELAACRFYAHMSILVSNEPEGFGYANLEAMLSGVPVITSRLGGPLDYIRHEETGLLVDPDDHHSLAIAIRRLDQDHQLYQRIANQAMSCAGQYTIERMIDGYMRVMMINNISPQFNDAPHHEPVRDDT